MEQNKYSCEGNDVDRGQWPVVELRLAMRERSYAYTSTTASSEVPLEL